jgi:uncharacterized Zn finger protein (UPF0148 family)
MAEAVAENDVCSKCGAEVREGTAFCYACGGRVTDDRVPENKETSNGVDAKSQAALDDLAQKLRGDDETRVPDDKLAKAAEERKKARVTQRKSRDFVWEPRNDMPVGFLISALVVLIVAVMVILITVVWK